MMRPALRLKAQICGCSYPDAQDQDRCRAALSRIWMRAMSARATVAGESNTYTAILFFAICER
jgi:hypothetical protein